MKKLNAFIPDFALRSSVEIQAAEIDNNFGKSQLYKSIINEND